MTDSTTVASNQQPWRAPFPDTIWNDPAAMDAEKYRRMQMATDTGRHAFIEYVRSHPSLSTDRPWLAFEGTQFIRDGCTAVEAAGDTYNFFYYIGNISTNHLDVVPAPLYQL